MTIQEAMNAALRRHQAGDLAGAEAICRQVLAQEPANPDLLYCLANLIRQMGRVEEAIVFYQRAVAIRPEWLEALNNFGDALSSAGRPDAAAAVFRHAIAIQPNLAELHFNLGNALWQMGQKDQAIAAYHSAMTTRADFFEAPLGLGAALYRMGRWDESLAASQKALALRPDSPEAHWNVGMILLLKGDLPAGLSEYEWRWRVKSLNLNPIHDSQSRWDGGELNGRRIVVYAEQGLGDTIQFVRYLPEIARRGGRIILVVDGSLIQLLAGFPGVEQIIRSGDSIPAHDVHCTLLSLPLLFKTSLATIPNSVPYITVDPKRIEQWRTRLPKNSHRRIGLVWAGSPRNPDDRNRSFPLNILSPLAAIKDIDWISLQTGPESHQSQSPPPGLHVTDFSEKLTDFAETAALITHLDLVITADTAVAHLAGAMGKPVWVLLPFVPDWRWMLDRADSPWYPTMRLFRQPDPGNWPAVIGKVVQRL